MYVDDARRLDERMMDKNGQVIIICQWFRLLSSYFISFIVWIAVLDKSVLMSL